LGWLQDVFGQNPAIKLLIDPSSGRIVDANEAAATFYGLSVAELRGLTIQHINTLPPEEVKAEMARARAGNRSFFRFEHRAAGGETRHVEVYTSPVEIDGKIRLLSIIHDVTDRERAVENLNRAQRMDAVVRVAGGVAHDFNNLLFVILGAADALTKAEPGRELVQRNVQRIREAALRASDLTRQLLLVSRGHEARGELIDVAVAVEDIVRLTSATFHEAVEVTVQVPSGIAVLLPRSSFDQVFLNLLVNARDALASGGTLAITARELEQTGEGSYLPGRYVAIDVSDSGVGMTADVAAKAFEPFFTTKEPGKGTGLGLSTAYGIVRRAGGTIEIDSAPGRGTTVHVVLPLAAPSESPALQSSPLPPSPRTTSPRGRTTILLVEDQRAIRELIEQSLVEAGYRVLSAMGAAQALALAEQHLHDIDLLVTDVVMPKMRGPELAARLRALRPTLPVVFMSGFIGDAIQDGTLDATDLLEKPFGSDALLARVEAALSRSNKRAP